MTDSQTAIRTMRPGLEVPSDTPGDGASVERGRTYLTRLEDDGQTLISDLRIDRHKLFNDLFHGVDGMHIGGGRRLRISPYLAYGERGVPGIIPVNAVLIVEVAFLGSVEDTNPIAT